MPCYDQVRRHGFPREYVEMRGLIGMAALLALAASSHALALGELAHVSIIDRDTGTPLTPHLYRGEYWIAGRPGARYGIQVGNPTAGRLLAVISVDGINVLSGDTAGWNQEGYVFDPLDSYQITGWRKSDSEVAAFTFTASPGSYAERTGRPANVGVIGVALFRERTPPPVTMTVPSPPPPPPSSLSRELPAPAASAAPAAEPPARGAAPGGAAGAPSRLPSLSPPEDKQQPQEVTVTGERVGPKLGTGHGGRESSPVTHTSFERLQDAPNEIVRIHYDSLRNLIAMGIIRAPDTPEPFPASPPRYVPDPPPQRP
jgi:hypothetical protein